MPPPSYPTRLTHLSDREGTRVRVSTAEAKYSTRTHIRPSHSLYLGRTTLYRTGTRPNCVYHSTFRRMPCILVFIYIPRCVVLGSFSQRNILLQMDGDGLFTTMKGGKHPPPIPHRRCKDIKIFRISYSYTLSFRKC